MIDGELLRARLRRLEGKSTWNDSDWAEARQLMLDGNEFRSQQNREALNDQLRALSGGDSGPERSTQHGLLAAMKEQHFDVKTNPRAYVRAEHALGVKTASFDGVIGEDTLPRVVGSPDLGVDTRFVYSRFLLEAVEPDVANVASYRQKARTLASPSDMIRAIDDVSQKPETSTSAEVISLPLQQVATVQTQVPLILFSSQTFRRWIETDVELAWRFAIDRMVMDAIDAAMPPTTNGGANVFEQILFAQEAVRAAGYSPDTVALSPADALSVELLQLSGGTTHAFSQNLPNMTISPALSDGEGFVCDSSSAGTLYSSPTRFEVFVDDAARNTYLCRYESDAAFAVHRGDAICTLVGGS